VIEFEEKKKKLKSRLCRASRFAEDRLFELVRSWKLAVRGVLALPIVVLVSFWLTMQ
jgi:hypothetical protein